MNAYIWMCPRCGIVQVEDEDEMCEQCVEETEGPPSEPVDVRMKRGYNRRLAEGFTKDR